MNYIHTPTLAQLSESEIRALNPNTSFGQPFVAPADYALVFPAPQPAYNPVTQSVQQAAPELTALGHWEQRWEVVELFETQEEKDEAIAADLEAKRVAAIPASVTMRQACIQLETDGLLDDVEAIVAVLPRVYQIEWQRASTVLRDNPLVEMVRQQQGMTSEQIDALFIAAAAL